MCVLRDKSFSPQNSQRKRFSFLSGVPETKVLKENGGTVHSTFSREKRITFVQAAGSVSPGPNTNFIYPMTISRNRSQMGLSMRMPDLKTIAPGPGSYHQESSFFSFTTSQVTMSKSKRETMFQSIQKSALMTPGPACYIGSATPKKIPGGAIGASLKFEIIKESTPGPGSYTPDLSKSFCSLPSAVMARTPRINIFFNEKSPGPSSYDTQTTPKV